MWNRAYASGLKFGGYADIKWLLEFLKPDMKVLEIGCGTGKTYLALRRHGICIDGIDISSPAISKLLQEAEQEGISVCAQIGDARKLEFSDESYDAIIAIHLLDALETEEERRQVVSEAARVLKNSGLFLCQVFCVEDFRFGKGKKLDEHTFERGGLAVTYFDAEGLAALLSKHFNAKIWHVGTRRSYGYRCVLRSAGFKKLSRAQG